MRERFGQPEAPRAYSCVSEQCVHASEVPDEIERLSQSAGTPVGDDHLRVALDDLSGARSGRRCGRYAICREHSSTNSSEPLRDVLAAWIVALFALVAGFSVLVLHVRDANEDRVRVVIPRWQPGPITGADYLDEIPDRGSTREWAGEPPDGGDGAVSCSAGDQIEGQGRSDHCAEHAPVLPHALEQ